MAATSLPVEYLFTMTATLSDPDVIRDGPQGGRMIFNVTGGSFEGPKMKGKVAASGGDWLHLRADNSGKLDVRATLLTDDGATIYVSYNGIVKDGQIRTAPLFETGDERYAWLNHVQAVGTGTGGGGSVTYDIYRLL
ncbi:MAG: DUF3237 domain-containing protein [Chloroflexi bacterium]|nr:DUF3237 domain-containing protein [Chloroflexota bacterium]